MASHPLLNVALRAARNAGDVIRNYSDRVYTLKVETKQRNDFVSEVDREAERVIIETIRDFYPNHGFIGEESGDFNEDAETVWIIDPLDGTTNYLRGIPHYAVSIAARQQGRLTAGVVYDPLREELFAAARGEGATLNGRKIRVNPMPGVEDALLGTGFPFRSQAYLDQYVAMFKDLYGSCSEMRRAGSAALDLAYVAAGRLDGFWEMGLKPWDIAAGVIIIQEAGGVVGDFTGGHKFMDNGNVLTGSPKLFAGLVKAVQPHLVDGLKR